MYEALAFCVDVNLNDQLYKRRPTGLLLFLAVKKGFEGNSWAGCGWEWVGFYFEIVKELIW